MKRIIYLIMIGLFFFIFGCVVLSITEEMENPFIITMTWNGETLEPDPYTGELPEQILDGDGAVVRASVTDEYGNTVVPDIYEWYLTGELISEGEDAIFLDNKLDIGNYWLDIIVGKDTILSSEQVDFIVVE